MIHSSLGTVVQETSNFLVEEKIIASPTTSVTFSDLDGIKDAGYVLEIAGINNSAASSQWFCYVNGDTTLANYHSTWIGQSSNTGGTATYTLEAEPYQVYGVGVGTRVFSKADILFCPGSGLTTFFSMTRSFYPTSTTNTGWSGYHEYRVAQANITSLTITSDVANAIGAGTVIRLYRKKQGVPSAFPSAQGMLVADILVPSTTSQVDITGLDGNLHGGYEVCTQFLAAGGTSEYLGVYINGDTTAGNYVSRRMYGNGGGATASDTAMPAIGLSYNGSWSLGVANIVTQGNHIGFLAQFIGNNSSSNASYVMNYATRYFGANNVTSLTFKSSSANMIAAGTKISVYRRK